MIIFRNKSCICGKKAGVNISNSKNNPGKLFYICENRQCKYFSRWEPDSREFTSCLPSFEENNSYSTILEEVKVLNAKMHTLDTNLNGRMQNLESIQSGLRMLLLLNMIIFCLSISIFFINVMKM